MQPPAYRGPVVVDRARAPLRYYLVNRSQEPLEGVRLSLLGSGQMLPVSSRRMQPGGIVAFAADSAGLSRTSVVIVRWFRPDGDEYLWRITF